MKMFDDEWWIDDAQKRLHKLNKRLNYGDRMSPKNQRALMRMIGRALKTLENAIWMKNFNSGKVPDERV